MKYLFSLCLVSSLIFSVGCKKKEEKKTPSTSTASGSTGGSSGGSGGSSGGSTYSVDTSITKKFYYTFQSLSATNGVDVTSPSFPSDGSPVIDSASVVTTLVSPAPVGSISGLIDYTNSSQTTPGTTASINGVASSRTHSITLTTDATTCSSSMSLTCTVNSGNNKKLDLTSIDTSTFTSSTTQFALTVTGSTLNVAMGQNKVSKMQNHDPLSSTVQLEMRNIVEAAELGDYVYFVANTTISGSTYYSLYRVHKTTYQTRLIFNPNQSKVTGGQIRNIAAFNGELYFTARSSSASSNYKLLKFNPTSDTITAISSSSDLLNASLLTVHNSYLYFKANSSGAQDKLYKMSTTGSIKQLTDICSSKTDVGNKMISTANGLYVSISDSSQCGNSNPYFAVSRIKNDDTIVPLARYNPGASTTEDGLGSIVLHNGSYYLSAGTSYDIIKDNNDGTVTAIVTSDGGWSTQAYPVKTFVKAGDYFYWMVNDTYWKYDFTDSKVKKLYAPNGTKSEAIYSVGSKPYFIFNNFSNDKIYTVDDTTNNIYQATTLYTSGNDEFSKAYMYNSELYFFSRNSDGNYKIFKITSDNQFVQVSNISGSNDLPSSSYNIVGSSGGLLLSTINNSDGQYILQ